MRSRCVCATVEHVVATTNAPAGLTICSAEDADWPAMARLAATCFGLVSTAGDQRDVALPWCPAMAPSHRRRGVLRAMFGELHRRMADASYPLAGLEASEGGIGHGF